MKAYHDCCKVGSVLCYDIRLFFFLFLAEYTKLLSSIVTIIIQECFLNPVMCILTSAIVCNSGGIRCRQQRLSLACLLPPAAARSEATPPPTALWSDDGPAQPPTSLNPLPFSLLLQTHDIPLPQNSAVSTQTHISTKQPIMLIKYAAPASIWPRSAARARWRPSFTPLTCSNVGCER